jgi:hypothetical protein
LGKDQIKHRSKRTIDVLVGDPQSSPTPCTQECVPAGVTPALCVATMRGAINFHDQSRANAGKIRDVRSNGMLSAKSHAIDAVSQSRPEHCFGACKVPAKRLGTKESLWCDPGHGAAPH